LAWSPLTIHLNDDLEDYRAAQMLSVQRASGRAAIHGWFCYSKGLGWLGHIGAGLPARLRPWAKWRCRWRSTAWRRLPQFYARHCAQVG